MKFAKRRARGLVFRGVQYILQKFHFFFWGVVARDRRNAPSALWNPILTNEWETRGVWEPRERAGEWGRGVGGTLKISRSWLAVTPAQSWKGS